VQLDLPFLRAEPPPLAPQIEFVRMRRAKRYIVRVRPDGSLRVTIPRGGSRREAESFLSKHREWAQRERLRVLSLHAPSQWIEGDEIAFRGAPIALRVERDEGRSWLVLGRERVRLRGEEVDLRAAAEHCLRAAARRELIPRLHELADRHGLTVSSVSIRNQRSRWGSCSRAGAVALNFRLVQAPDEIRDYVLIHELMHLKQQNHSRRFWRLVEAACPGFREAERWLRTEGRSLF
jgi:predicted metal-dependent hydrolase